MTDWSERLRRAICRLLIVMAGILPFVFCWLSDELFEFNKMLAVYAFASVTGCLFAARMVAAKRFIWKKTIFDWPIAAFLLSQLIATIWSLHPRTSFLGYYTRLNGGLLSTIAYIVIYYVYINNFTTHERRRLIQVLTLSSALVSLYAIGEHFGHSLSCLIIKGQFDVSCWVQDVQTRVYATLGQPNWLAAYNVTIIGLLAMLTLSVWQNQRETWLKIALPISLVLNFCSLLFTKSRSGIIAFGAGVVFSIVCLLIVWAGQKKAALIRQSKLLAALLALFVIPALIWGTQYTPRLSELLARAHAQTLEMGLPAHLQGIDVKITDSADIRKIVWRGALDIWRHHFWFGTGVETFAYSYYLYRPNDHNWTSEWDYLYNKAHNELLNLAANSGFFGLASYISIFVVLGFITLKYLTCGKKDPDYREKSLYLIGSTAALLALSITNFFGFSTVSVQVLLFLFLALAAQIYSGQNAAIPAKIDETWQKITFVSLAGVAFILLNQVWKTWYADYNYARCKSLITRVSASQALDHCLLAIELRPQEALYRIELASFYAQYALALAKQTPDQTEAIAQFRDLALALSNSGLALNPYNLNFYKTRYQMFTSLATIAPEVLDLAKTDLETALQLSPTDPKITYYYSRVLAQSGDRDGATTYLARTLTLRPLYLEARLQAARDAEDAGDLETALTHYRYIDAFIESNPNITQAIARLATAAATLREELP